MNKILVNAKWLRDHLSKVVPLDSSWFLASAQRFAYKEYLEKHIPGARFFDIDKIADQQTSLPHMLPSQSLFESEVGKLGISENDHIVVYDSAGLGPACRAYWTFKVFGHEKISILNGGLPSWSLNHYPLESGEPQVSIKTYSANYQPQLVKSLDQVVNATQSKSSLIVDARPSGRFKGIDPEPRAALQSGHMPHSVNVPAPSVIDPITKTLLPEPQLRTIYQQAGIDLNQPIIHSCGSGVMASVNYVAMEVLGAKQISVYDGSWSEYAASGNPIEKE